MIRIDEIYDTVFRPIILSKPRQSMHYFSPFGKTDVGSMRVNPLIISREKTFLFWDQEPYCPFVHQDTIDYFHKSFIHTEYATEFQKYHGQLTPYDMRADAVFVTSEKNSEVVDALCDTKGYESSYYFFHGWASLDWFRGYDRTFLIPRAKDRAPSTTFISPNRIIGGKRDHRVLFMYHIFNNTLENNHITCPEVCSVEGINIKDIALKYKSQYPNISDTFNDADLPYLFRDEDTQVMSSCWLTNFDESADSVFYVPTETVYFGKRLHLTEKTFKAIALEMPFILVATGGSLEYLRSYGFKTFDGIIDESYDLETNDFKRLEKVTQLLKSIDDLTEKEKLQLHHDCLPIVEHNYNHFYYGGFETILWKELINMIDTWK
jgi:hypothetical protein